MSLACGRAAPGHKLLPEVLSYRYGYYIKSKYPRVLQISIRNKALEFLVFSGRLFFVTVSHARCIIITEIMQVG